jgi:hypothetical protein
LHRATSSDHSQALIVYIYSHTPSLLVGIVTALQGLSLTLAHTVLMATGSGQEQLINVFSCSTTNPKKDQEVLW